MAKLVVKKEFFTDKSEEELKELEDFFGINMEEDINNSESETIIMEWSVIDF